MASGQSDGFCKEVLIMITPTLVRIGLSALAIVALGFLPGVSVANPPSATGHGSLMVNGDLRTFSFSAIQHHDGKVTGQAELHIKASGVVIHMDIDCLNFIAPNMVVVSGRVKKSSVPNIEGLTGTFAALDNDTKESPKDKEASKKLPDELSRLAVGGGDCLSSFSLPTIPIEHGKIEVRP
jgi:hypothetical protein